MLSGSQHTRTEGLSRPYPLQTLLSCLHINASAERGPTTASVSNCCYDLQAPDRMQSRGGYTQQVSNGETEKSSDEVTAANCCCGL